MKRQSFLLLTAVFVLNFGPLHGQSDSAKSDTRLGIGISAASDVALGSSELLFVPLSLANIYIPIHVSSHFRLEPEIGLLRSTFSSNGFKGSATNIRIGLGIFAQSPKEKMNFYYGLRAGVIQLFESSGGNDDSTTDFYIGPACGGEYFMNTNASLGGEVQLNYIAFDQNGNSSYAVLTTRTQIFLRWYFK